MDELILKLMNYYKTFVQQVTEYTVLNNYIKAYVKSKNNRALVEYYSLEIKNIDKSFYQNDIVPYLKKNKLDRFITKNVDNKKINELIQKGDMDESLVLCYIEKEKTILDIKTKNMKEDESKLKYSVSARIKKMNLIDIVRRRELLKLEINESRFKYFNLAKQTKDKLLEIGELRYRFSYDNDICQVKIKMVDRIYNKEFISYLEVNNIDAFKYTVNSDKLKKSKDKKLDRVIINKYITMLNQEYLYVRVLPGILGKYKFK